VETTARVIAVSPSLVTPGVGGYSVGYGAAASVQAGSVAILLASAREQAMSPDMFEAMGVALAGRKAVVVKSSQHFHAGYAPLASQVLYADSPGALRLDLSSIPYTLARRGLWMPGSEPGEPNPPPSGAP
jgi:microcystin degradation protein MlrC